MITVQHNPIKHDIHFFQRLWQYDVFELLTTIQESFSFQNCHTFFYNHIDRLVSSDTGSFLVTLRLSLQIAMLTNICYVQCAQLQGKVYHKVWHSLMVYAMSNQYLLKQCSSYKILTDVNGSPVGLIAVISFPKLLNLPIPPCLEKSLGY